MVVSVSGWIKISVRNDQTRSHSDGEKFREITTRNEKFRRGEITTIPTRRNYDEEKFRRGEITTRHHCPARSCVAQPAPSSPTSATPHLHAFSSEPTMSHANPPPPYCGCIDQELAGPNKNWLGRFVIVANKALDRTGTTIILLTGARSEKIINLEKQNLGLQAQILFFHKFKKQQINNMKQQRQSDRTSQLSL